jgi:hypothetical protein
MYYFLFLSYFKEIVNYIPSLCPLILIFFGYVALSVEFFFLDPKLQILSIEITIN